MRWAESVEKVLWFAGREEEREVRESSEVFWKRRIRAFVRRLGVCGFAAILYEGLQGLQFGEVLSAGGEAGRVRRLSLIHI